MTKHFLSGVLIGGLTLYGWMGRTGAQTASQSGAASPDNPTFYKALRAVGDSLGRSAMENIVEASGQGGVPQPNAWKLIVKEGTGAREVEVTDGKVTAQHLSDHPVFGGVVKLSELNLDSSGAFDAADAQARKVKLRYDSLNYTLRVGPTSGRPVWTIDLLNQEGNKVGLMRLAAHDGTTISTEGRLANNTLAPTTSVPTTASSERTPTVVARATPSPTRRPVVTETREHTTTSTYTATTTSRGGPPATPPPPPATYSATTTMTQRDIPVATLSDRQDDGPTASTTTTETTRDEGGGLFTRTGRTLDKTSQTVGNGFQKTSQTVESSFRKAGSKIQRFFTRRGDDDDQPEPRNDRDNRVENPRD